MTKQLTKPEIDKLYELRSKLDEALPRRRSLTGLSFDLVMRRIVGCTLVAPVILIALLNSTADVPVPLDVRGLAILSGMLVVGLVFMVL